jgi:hypothetical protein
MPCSQPAALPSPGSWKRPRLIQGLREQLRDQIERVGLAHPGAPCERDSRVGLFGDVQLDVSTA